MHLRSLEKQYQIFFICLFMRWQLPSVRLPGLRLFPPLCSPPISGDRGGGGDGGRGGTGKWEPRPITALPSPHHFPCTCLFWHSKSYVWLSSHTPAWRSGWGVGNHCCILVTLNLNTKLGKPQLFITPQAYFR